MHVGDGRAFLEDTSQKYNLILFALPDSTTALAGQSALRLESFLLTEESLAAAKSHLAPGGTFSMYNYYQPFLLDRYATTTRGRIPPDALCRLQPGGRGGGRVLAALTVHPGGQVAGCSTYWHGPSLAPATDDHPFPYLQTRHHPHHLPVDARGDPARVAGVHTARRRPLQGDAVLHRPSVHGCRLPAARNQEHRPVRLAVRHHLVCEFPRLCRGPARGVPRGRDRQTGTAATAGRARTASSSRRWPWPGWCPRNRCSPCRWSRASSRPAPWPSHRYSSRTWCSRSGSPTCKTRGRPSPSTFLARWSVARSSTCP